MILRIPKSMLISLKDFYRDEGIFLSASLAFFSILSIIPLSMFIVNVLVSFTQEETIARFFYNKLLFLFPNIEFQMIKEIKKLLAARGINEVSLILYGIFSIQLFTAIEFCLNKIFRVPKKRHFIFSLLISTFIVFIIIFFVGASFAISYIIRISETHMATEINTILKIFLKYVVTFLLIFTVIVCLYKFLPNKKVKTSHVLIGSFITTLLIEIAKHLFTFYVSDVIKINTLYGSISTFLAILMWLFYAWAVFLYGAELIANLERKK